MTFERLSPALENVIPVIGANSEVFAKGDPVMIDSDGFLAHVGTTTVVFGYALEAATMASDNETVAKKTVKVQHALGVKMRVDVDEALEATDIGMHADLATAATGGDVLDGTVGTTGQFFVVQKDPDAEGSGSDDVAIVMASEIQGLIGASQAV
jgi:hypothetical protein